MYPYIDQELGFYQTQFMQLGKKILTRVLAYSVVGAVDVCRQFITALNQTKIFFADKTPNI